MEEWEKSLEKLQVTPPHRVRDTSIYVLRHPNESDVMRKLNEGEELTEEEIEILPEGYRNYYYFSRQDSQKEEERIIEKYRREKLLENKKLKQEYEAKLIARINRKTAYDIELTDEERAFNESLKKRAEKTTREEKRRIQAQANQTISAKETEHYEKILEKLKKWQPLSPGEKEFLDKYGQRKKNQPRGGNVDIDSSLILTDVINGDYSLQDVHLVKEGAAALNKDAIESSPIQLLEQVLESMKRSTQEALQTSDTDHFFNSIDADLLNRITPLQLNEIVSSCKTGIEMLHGNLLDEDESKSALQSFIKALVMSEGENKIKEALKAAETKLKIEQRRADETLAEIAAVSGAFSEDASKLSGEKEAIDLGFNITEYDISFVPNDDPELYKPIEIISYLGMTNCPTN